MPNEQKATRKLRAIFSADVKGYSLLMSDDETFTIQTLKAYRKILSNCIEKNAGRVVDSPGDNVLAEFASAVDAVQCAVEIQRHLKKENDRLVKDKRLEFRIGVNIGDVVQDGERIYGSGVNVAARIEGLADAGGICISRNAYDHVKDKLELGFEYLGEHEVKNIEDPVRVYRLLLDVKDAGKLIGEKKKPSTKKWLWVAVAAVAILAINLIWQFYHKTPLTDIEPASLEEMAYPLPDKPSIAVLPFANMSDDPEQEYFSDGMTDDIITDLSKISGLIVISRNSSFTYKGREINIPEVAQRLGVRYILEGSVRKADNQVRINAQLIDAKTDHHIWADRFDDTMKNIFSLQDKVTEKIVSALALKLSPNETNKLASKGTDNIEAHDLYLKGKAHLRRWTRDDLMKAIDYFKQALEMDPNYSEAYVGLAQAHQQKITGGSQISDRMDADSATPYFLVRHYVELAMKKPTPGAYSILASLEILRRHYDEAKDLAEKAVALAPNDADSLIALGSTLMWADKSIEAIPYVKEAMRLNPLEANLILGFVYFSLEQYEAALESAEKSLQDNSKLMRAHIISAVSYAHLGREDKAKEAFNKYLTSLIVIYPDMQFIYFNYPFKNPAVFHRFVEGLVKAGYQKDPNDYYKVDASNKLNGEEIKELVFGKTMVYSWLGLEPFVSIDEQGGAEWALPTIYNTSYVGKSWIESDALCSQYKFHREGVKHCYDIYNNPEGSDNEKSKYLMLGDSGLMPLSVLHQNPEWFKDLVKDTDIRQ